MTEAPAFVSLVEFAQQKAAADRRAFLWMAWNAEAPEHLLGKAQAAGIAADEADRLVGLIDQLRPLRARLPELLAQRLVAAEAAEGLVRAREQHAAAVNNAKRAVAVAEERSRDEARKAETLEHVFLELLNGERLGLAPPSILSIEADIRAALEEKKLAKLRAFQDSLAAIDEAKQKLSGLEELLARMQRENIENLDLGSGPIGIDDVRERITLTRSRMDDLEAALPAAAEAARAAGHSIATPTNAR